MFQDENVRKVKPAESPQTRDIRTFMASCSQTRDTMRIKQASQSRASNIHRATMLEMES